MIVGLVLITGNNLFSQEASWDFPVKPGTEEWKSLKNRYERCKACQIPDDVLPTLSTDQLIELCLNFPFLYDIRAFDNTLTGFDKYSREFNGFQELLKRSDAALILKQKYKGKNPLAIEKDWSSYDKFDYAFKISMMELFFCNKQILSQLDTNEKKDLMNEYRLKKSQKNNMIELYQNHDFQTIYLAIVKLLESENIDLSRNINMDIVTSYITTGILKSKDVFKEINNTVKNYLLNDLKPINEESTYFEDNIQVILTGNVLTPKGYDVLAAIQSEGNTPQARANMDANYLSLYPGASLIPTYGEYGGEELSSTNRFNCHGYAWHVSERGASNTAEYRVIDRDDIKIYWQDYTSSSYIKLTPSFGPPNYLNCSGAPAYPGKITYQPEDKRDHSAIIAPTDPNKPGWVISKWGPGPLMFHHPENCPFSPLHDTYGTLTLNIYKLNPNIFPQTNPSLCYDSERTFSTDITSLPAGSLKWTHGNFLTQVGADNNYQYKVKGAGNGSTYVHLKISTQSDSIWGGTKSFHARILPTISQQKVDGITYQYGMGVSPGVGHWLSFVPYPNLEIISDTWTTIPDGIQYSIDQVNHRLGFYFLNNSKLEFEVQTTNICGTGPKSSYYLIRQRGLSALSGMTLFPNPASDNVTITMMENIPLTEYSDSTGFTSLDITDSKGIEVTTYTIRIYNSQGTLLSACKRSGKSFNIPLINMKDGTYIIEISDREKSYRQQLIVKHN